MKKSLLIIVLSILSFIGLVSCASNIPGTSAEPSGTPVKGTIVVTPIPAQPTGLPPTPTASTQEAGYKDIGYIIDGQLVELTGSASTIQDPSNPLSETITNYFGKEAFGDLNGDGQEDVAFLLTQNKGGSGTFFYVVAAIKTRGGYTGTNGVFLGDRIAPLSTQISDGTLIVNYGDRRPEDPFTMPPSIGITMVLKVEGNTLMEVNMPSRITDHTWVWVSTTLNDGTSVVPKKSEAFTISFSLGGEVSGTTDCNNFFGTYTMEGEQLNFGQLASTLMACEGSQETEFTQALSQVDRFLIDEGGTRLVLLLKMDSGSMTFR